MRNGGTSGIRILILQLLDDQSFWKMKSPEKKKNTSNDCYFLCLIDVPTATILVSLPVQGEVCQDECQ